MANGRPVIVGLGEVLWDVFPDGPRFGGAPANFACSAKGLAGDAAAVEMVTGVGRDDLGQRAIGEFEQRRVGVGHVARSDRPTGTVDVTLDEQGVGSYEFAANTAWDVLEWNDDLGRLAGRTDAVCFGSLGQRSATTRETIRRFVAATPNESLRVLDVNLRPPFDDERVVRESLEPANVLKLNDDELPRLAKWCGLEGAAVEVMRALARTCGLQAVALTRGPDGAVLVRGDEVAEHAGEQAEVADTVGAGDAFTAAMVLGLLRGRPLAEVNRAACKVAAYVCSQPGATPVMPAGLLP